MKKMKDTEVDFLINVIKENMSEFRGMIHDENCDLIISKTSLGYVLHEETLSKGMVLFVKRPEGEDDTMLPNNYDYYAYENISYSEDSRMIIKSSPFLNEEAKEFYIGYTEYQIEKRAAIELELL